MSSAAKPSSYREMCEHVQEFRADLLRLEHDLQTQPWYHTPPESVAQASPSSRSMWPTTLGEHTNDPAVLSAGENKRGNALALADGPRLLPEGRVRSENLPTLPGHSPDRGPGPLHCGVARAH